MTFNLAGGQTYSLGSSIGSTDTTILLTSFTEGVSGTQYSMANLNTDICYATIAPGTSSSEFISFTGITANIDGTSTLTGVTRGLSKKYPFTSSATFKLPHSSQTTFILSNPPQIYNKFVSIVNDETVAGVKTFSSFPITPSSAPTTDYQTANKKYVDDAVIAGAVKATNLVYGISKLSVAAASASDPIVVGTNDNRVSPVSLATVTSDIVAALAGTGTPNGTTGKYVTNDDTSATTAANKVYRQNANGKIDATLLEGNLPAISGASLTNLPVPVVEQDIAFQTSNVVNTASFTHIASDNGGNTLYIATQGADSDKVLIMRLAKDTLSQQYYITHTATLTGVTVLANVSLTVAGNYVYVSFIISLGATQVERYDKANLANPALMTISGTSPGVSINIFNDGSNLYLSNNTTDQFQKYSISGTTMTYVSTITYTSSGPGPAYSDGINVWITDSTSSGGVINIRKYALAGGAVISTTSPLIFQDAYPNNGSIQLYLAKTGILGIGWGHTIESNSAVKGSAIKLTAITLP